LEKGTAASFELPEKMAFKTATYLKTARTVINKLVVPLFSLVKMNSKRLLLHFVDTHNDSVAPRSF